MELVIVKNRIAVELIDLLLLKSTNVDHTINIFITLAEKSI